MSGIQCHLAHDLAQSVLHSSQLSPQQMHEACQVMQLGAGLLQTAHWAIWKQKLRPYALQMSAQLLWERCDTALLAHTMSN